MLDFNTYMCIFKPGSYASHYLLERPWHTINS